MELTFEVGSGERHEVVYSWDQMWGREFITVDGEKVHKTVRLLSFSLVHGLDVGVGVSEKHAVHIEKRRELFFPAFRPQIVTAFVDGQPVATGAAALTRRQVRSLVIFGAVVFAVALTMLGLTMAELARVLLSIR